LIAYFIGNISAKQYQNPFTSVKVIANQRWNFFETLCSSSDKQSQKSSSSFSRTVPRHTGCLRQSTIPITLPNVQHVATLRCDVLLIIIHVSGFFCFSDINISQGIVVTRLRCGGMFYYYIARDLLLSLSVKEF